jgi:hypothetical protein
MKINKYISAIFIILVMVNCSQDNTIIDLGNGYRFDNDPVISNDNAIFGPLENTYAVSGHIVAYNFDSIFIVAEQKPREIILKSTYSNPEMTYQKQEKIFEVSTLRHYWIINKLQDSILGPFNKEEYIQKREELSVPRELQLKK